MSPLRTGLCMQAHLELEVALSKCKVFQRYFKALFSNRVEQGYNVAAFASLEASRGMGL